MRIEPTDPTPQPPDARDIPFPYPHAGAYRAAGLPRPSHGDAQQMPIYQDGDRLMVGVDQGAQHLGDLPAAGQRGGIDIRHGRLNHGVGLGEVRRYLTQVAGDPEVRWKTAPVVRFGGDGDQADFERVIRAVQLVNAALPEGRNMTVASDTASSEPASGIYVGFSVNFGDSHWGATVNSNRGGQVSRISLSYIAVNKLYTSNGDRQATILLAHEISHALGLAGGTRAGHVSEDFDSILEGTQRIYATAQGIPQPVSLLYPADREALRALYSHFEGGAEVASFGPWASTSTNIVGTGEHGAFGVRFANGYGEPWAYGLVPDTVLSSNPALSGTVTWEARWSG